MGAQPLLPLSLCALTPKSRPCDRGADMRTRSLRVLAVLAVSLLPVTGIAGSAAASTTHATVLAGPGGWAPS
jgi:hypothetical protein